MDTKAPERGDEAGDRVKTGDYAKSWLESKALHVDVGTVERYGLALRHALDKLGEIYLHELRSADIQSWVDSEIRAGYAPDTIRSWFSAVRTMVRDAVAALELPRDATQRIRLPEPAEKREENAFTPEELMRFLALMREHYPQHYGLVATLAFTGLRFCHVSPLMWADIDFDAKTITIRRKQVKGVIGPVSRKKRALRTYSMSPKLAEILKWHRSESPGLPKAWVFPSCEGKLRRGASSSLSRAWSKCLDLSGIQRRITVHGLRRTFTDLARLAGVGEVVARSLVGHTKRMREHYSLAFAKPSSARPYTAYSTSCTKPTRLTLHPQKVGPRVGPGRKPRKPCQTHDVQQDDFLGP
ncbi:MAG: site-specific integrase [Proteobacteria bacterium]|nr:site-specific integrase [Pseudomonadota bacterium]